jgi:glycosyltransferase involved in cell wall biosynthesis
LAFISSFSYNFFFPGAIKVAGGQTPFYNLTRKFAELSDYQVNCVVGDFGQPSVLEKDGVRIIKAPINHPLKSPQVLKALRSLDVDVYLDFCASPRLFLLRMLKTWARKPYIFFTGSDIDVNGEYRDIENIFYYWAYINGLKHADSIICQVPDQVSILKDRYNLSSELVLSPYFDILPRKLKKKKDIVLWVGRAARYKNPKAFIELVQNFPNEKFVMICNASGYDDDFMGSISRTLKNFENLSFKEYVPYTEIHKYFESAKLLVNTSDFEGFPNTFIEAAMNFTPILSLSVDPNRMLSNHKGGVCCGGDMGQLITAFKELVGNEGKLDEYGEYAYRYAEKYHQLDAAVLKIDGIIRGVLRKGQR